MKVSVVLTLPDSLEGDSAFVELQSMYFNSRTVTIETDYNAPVRAKISHIRLDD